MHHAKPLAIGAYVAITAYFFDMMWALIFTLLGRPASYVGPLLLAITTAYFVADVLFRRWNTTRKKRVLAAGAVFVGVIFLGKIAIHLTLSIWSANR